jgi:hypothetical protein
MENKETQANLIGAEALALFDRWSGHENGLCAASNTLFAVFGVPQGRFRGQDDLQQSALSRMA